MNWQIGQYLLFPTKVAKITNVKGDKVALRCLTKGNTKNGYSWQQNVTKKHLTKLFNEGHMACIGTEDILRFLFKEYVLNREEATKRFLKKESTIKKVMKYSNPKNTVLKLKLKGGKKNGK